MATDKSNEEHDEFTLQEKSMSSTVDAWAGMSIDAKQATAAEHQLSFFQGIRLYRKAVVWSIALSTSLVMEGYDNALIGNFFGLPSFQQKYGSYYPGIGFQVSAGWQVALGLATNIGLITGSFINGPISERFGFKRVMLGSYIVMTCFIFITFFAPSTPVLFVGEVLLGFPWGVCQSCATAYASDVCPVVLRAHLTMYINICWVFGQFIAAGVLQGFVSNASQWSYRIPFAIQWVWPIPLFCIVCFAPESPWWFVRKGRLQDAERSVKRLSSPSEKIDPKQTVAMMVHTNNLERKMETETSFRDCFKGTNLRRTEIACGAFLGACFTSFVLGGQTAYFLEQAGLPASNAFKLTVGSSAMGVASNMLSWVVVLFVGRRKLFLSGFVLLGICMFIIGFVSLAPSSDKGASWAQGVLMLLWSFCDNLTIYPTNYTISTEVSATRLRVKTWAFARSTFYLFSIVNTVITPYLINPTEANLKGKAGFLTGGLMVLSFIWAYFRLPECKGRTYEELDILFKNHVPARKFAKYEVDAYAQITVDDIEQTKPTIFKS